MHNINIKPLSVNQLYRGRRFKTDTYNIYSYELNLKLPNIKVPKGKLKLNIVFGFSNVNSDLDNPVKAFQDILQKKYDFNDRDIYELNVKKEIVKKGNEFIKFILDEL